MSKEYWVMVVLTVASVLLLWVFCRDKLRPSLFLLVAAQTATWPITIFTAFAGKIESPVRLFPIATDSNFIIAFIFAPAVIVAYYWNYPRDRSRILQVAYSLAVAGGLTLVHVTVQKYTDLLRYITISGYTMWLVSVVSNYAVRIYADWYFGQLAKARSGNQR